MPILILLYFIAKYYSRLAKKYDKSGFPFAVLGIFCFFVGVLLAGICYRFLTAGKETFLNASLNGLFIISLPITLVPCVVVYAILANNWKKEANPPNSDILDA